MKLYKYLTLMVLFGMTLVLFGMASAAYATPIDPTIILHGDGKSMPILGVNFGGEFPTPTPTTPFACPTDGPDSNCFQNANPFTFIGIHLFFDNTALSYSCDNSQDPFFTNCSVSDNEVTFSGLGFDATGLCGGEDQDGCPGIVGGNHFAITIVGLPAGDMTGYSGVADVPAGTTPEPASVLLFVIAFGAIALFLKRA